MSQIEWKTTERGTSKVGNFSHFVAQVETMVYYVGTGKKGELGAKTHPEDVLAALLAPGTVHFEAGKTIHVLGRAGKG